MNVPVRQAAWFARFLLLVLYALGFGSYCIGLPDVEWWLPLGLVVAAVVVFVFHFPWTRAHRLFCILVLMATYGVELVGMHSQWVFGHYTFGDGLGIKVFGVPVLVGVYWLLLIYCCGMTVLFLGIQPPWRALSGAACWVVVDLLTQPLATVLSWKQWVAPSVGVQNYVAGFYISFIILWFFYRLPQHSINRMAVFFLAVHTLFLILLHLFLPSQVH